MNEWEIYKMPKGLSPEIALLYSDKRSIWDWTKEVKPEPTDGSSDG